MLCNVIEKLDSDGNSKIIIELLEKIKQPEIVINFIFLFIEKLLERN